VIGLDRRIRLYVDGVLRAQSATVDGTADLTGFAQQTSIGSSSGAAPWFRGTIDDVAVYDRGLTPETIADHHAAGSGL
jgi:hypothetical protein